MPKSSMLPARTWSRRFSLPLFALLIFLFSGLAACSTTGILASSSWQAGSLRNERLQVLAVDPNHLDNFYAGDAQDGIFVSTDAGITWKNSSTGLTLPSTINALSYDISGKKLYAATSAGLFVSANAASSWVQVAGLPSDIMTTLAFDANSPQVIYVGTGRSGVWKSSDGGTDWTGMSSGLPANSEVTSMLYDQNLKQLWAAFADTLYRSDDGGTSWRTMDAGLPANVGLNALASGYMAADNTSLLFVGTEHGFFLSTDEGQHWAQSQTSLADLHIQAVLVDATQDNVVYASTNIGVLRSQDNGQSWQQVASGLPSGQPINGLVQGGDNYGQLLVASRGIYLYPGSQSALDPTRLIPLLIILLFFVFLYRFFIVGRRRARQMAAGPDLSPVSQSETGSEVTDEI